MRARATRMCEQDEWAKKLPRRRAWNGMNRGIRPKQFGREGFPRVLVFEREDQ
jgi:hypothetical protein